MPDMKGVRAMESRVASMITKLVEPLLEVLPTVIKLKLTQLRRLAANLAETSIPLMSTRGRQGDG